MNYKASLNDAATTTTTINSNDSNNGKRLIQVQDSKL